MTFQPDSLVKHKHHIIPKYRGGSNDPSNLVEVSIVQHSMWHFCNYQLWGAQQDKVAWMALAGIIGKEELVVTLQNLGIESAKSPEARKKRAETYKRNNHQIGQKNSQYNTMWIYNLKLAKNRKIKREEAIPEGWFKGRIQNFFDPYLQPDGSRIKKPRPKREKRRLGIPRNWFHKDHGYVLNTTSSELHEKYKDQKLDKGALSQVSLGKNKHHKGWSTTLDIPDLTLKGDKKLNWSHPAHGGILFKSMRELIVEFKEENLTYNGLSKVVNGKNKSHKNWKLLTSSTGHDPAMLP